MKLVRLIVQIQTIASEPFWYHLLWYQDKRVIFIMSLKTESIKDLA